MVGCKFDGLRCYKRHERLENSHILVTRDCLYYSTSLNTRVDTNLLELYARAWSARWEDRTKADAFVAAMGRIREEMLRQYEDDLERRLERRRRGDYGSDYDRDEEDY